MSPKQQSMQSRVLGTKLVEAKIVQCQSCKFVWQYLGESNHHCHCPNPDCGTKVTFYPSKLYPTNRQKVERERAVKGVT